mgnify:FL=1
MSRIAVLSYDYPPNDGGISRLASALVVELSQRNFDVNVLSIAADGRAGLVRPDVPTREVPRSRLRRDLATFQYLWDYPKDACILATVWNPEATLAWLTGKTNITVMAHGNEVMPYSRRGAPMFKRRLRRRILAAAQTVVCNSRYTEQLVLELSPDANTVVIRPAVDAVRFSADHDKISVCRRLGLPKDKLIVLSVSRLDAYKGHDTVLHALAKLDSSLRAKLHYAVAGQGGHLQELQNLAVELQLVDCVSWLGFVSEDELPGLYACADLFVLCTREDSVARGVEGFGMVFLEAQASGLPVLGTRAGGIPDAIVEGQGGWLVPQDDLDAVAEHLAQLAQNPEPYRQQGALGRERVCREASWARYADQLLDAMKVEHV